ncbi:MAG: hypothetical protein AB3N33_07060 [Puniceicoccaceae bacterium]
MSKCRIASGPPEVFNRNKIPSLLQVYHKKTSNISKTPPVLILTGEERENAAIKLFRELQRNAVPSSLIKSSLEHDATRFHDRHLESIIAFERDYLCP